MGLSRRTRQIVFRTLGWCLLAVPLVPVRFLFGEIRGATGLVPPPEWLLAAFVFGAPAWLLARYAPQIPLRLEASARAVGRVPDRAFHAAVLTGLLALLLATAVVAFARRPLLVDSMIQLFQARIFAAGRLTAPAPPGEAFFATQHMLVDGGRWYSQYPPGHSVLLAAGVLLGRPWIVPIVLSVGTAALLTAFSRRIYGRAEGRLTLVLCAAAPFFWFMGASHMNHVTALFFVAAFLLAFAAWESRGGASRLLGAGVLLGAAFLIRPLTAVAFGTVFGAGALRIAVRRGRKRDLAWGTAGLALAAIAYVAYNAATTGNPLLPGYLKLWGGSHGLGFHETPWGEVHSPVAGLRNELVDLGLLSSFLFEWPLPALLPVGVLFAAGWAGDGWDRRLLLGFLALPAAYFFYWHRDAFLGPRYLYSGLAPLLPLTARALLEVHRRLERRSLWGATGRPARATGPVTLLVALCVAYAALYSAPRRFGVYRSGLASMKVDLPRRAAEVGIDRGLVFVSVSWGNRLIARARGSGVPAAVIERAYRRADHCALEEILGRARAERWSPDRTTAAVDALPAGGRRLGARSPNGDPTLRLDPATLTQRCAVELRYDAAGYGNFSPHLADDDPLLEGPLIFARDLRLRNHELRERFDVRPAYVYRPGRFVLLGD